jgi:hypothetical protein
VLYCLKENGKNFRSKVVIIKSEYFCTYFYASFLYSYCRAENNGREASTLMSGVCKALVLLFEKLFSKAMSHFHQHNFYTCEKTPSALVWVVIIPKSLGVCYLFSLILYVTLIYIPYYLKNFHTLVSQSKPTNTLHYFSTQFSVSHLIPTVLLILF